MADNGPVGRCDCFLDSVLTVFSATSQLYSLDLYSPRSMKQTNINIVSSVILQAGPGASTPYKRWSKCTMKKIGGKVFAGT